MTRGVCYVPGIELSATPPVSIGNTVIDVQSRIVVIQGDRVEFTSKEFDLLCFFAKYPNWALTIRLRVNAEIRSNPDMMRKHNNNQDCVRISRYRSF